MIDVHFDKNNLKKSNLKIRFDDNLMELVEEWESITDAIIKCAAVMYVPEENQAEYIEKTKLLLGASLICELDTDIESVIKEVKRNIEAEGEQ